MRMLEQAEDIPAQRHVQRKEGTAYRQNRQDNIRQSPENKCIKDVADILQRERPHGAVQGVDLIPAADVQTGPARNDQQTHHQCRKRYDKQRDQCHRYIDSQHHDNDTDHTHDSPYEI